MPHFLICSSSSLIYFLGCFFPQFPPIFQVIRKRRVPGTGLLPPSPWLWTVRQYVSILRKTCFFCKELALKPQPRPEVPNLVRFMDPLGTWWASLEAQTVKNLPVMQETLVPFLCQDDPLEEGLATNSSILAWRIPWTEEPGGATVHGFACNNLCIICRPTIRTESQPY